MAINDGLKDLQNAGDSMSAFKSIFEQNNTGDDSDMTFEKAADIAGSYSDVLEYSAPSPGTVADASKLPYPKALIKQAIILLLEINTDLQIKEQLIFAYLLLADWQEGVGNTNAGLDLSNMELTTGPAELAERVSAQDDADKMWTNKAEKERRQLRTELQELGYL
jgi:hypothetical protein